nr:MAG: hypothetical protein [Bacteriophage sp.]
MEFLDLNGLTHFWNKVKTFISYNYLSLNGGKIKGIVNVLNKNDTTEYISIDSSSINNSKYPPHYLFANGKMVPIGEANGVASLDSEGNVPLRHLGNIDTTFAEVVTALPKTNIKKHIYLIKVFGITQNQYEEYIYTGDTNAEYDDSKWEKLGNFTPTVDLADYAKKTDTVKNISFSTYGSTNLKILRIVKADNTIDNVTIPMTSIDGYGFMDESDKRKLDGIENNANNYSLPTASSTTKGGITLGYSQSGKNYPVVLDSTGKAYVNVPWIDTTYDLTTYAQKNETIHELILDTTTGNTITFNINYANGDQRKIIVSAASQDYCGLMSNVDKTKLDNISSGATADSAITTAEIDALFA